MGPWPPCRHAVREALPVWIVAQGIRKQVLGRGPSPCTSCHLVRQHLVHCTVDSSWSCVSGWACPCPADACSLPWQLRTPAANVSVLLPEGWQVVNVVGGHQRDLGHWDLLPALRLGALHHLRLQGMACSACLLTMTNRWMLQFGFMAIYDPLPGQGAARSELSGTCSGQPSAQVDMQGEHSVFKPHAAKIHIIWPSCDPTSSFSLSSAA